MKTFSLSNRFAIALIAGSLAASTALAQGEFEGSGEIADPNCVGDGCGYISADQVSEDQAAAPNDENAESFSYSENGATSEEAWPDTTEQAAAEPADESEPAAETAEVATTNIDEEDEESQHYVAENAAEYRARKEGFSKGVQFGIRATLGVNKNLGKGASDWNIGPEIGGGLMAKLPLGRTFAISTELNFSYRLYSYEGKSEYGQKDTDSKDKAYSNNEASINEALFEIPVIGQFIFDEDGFFIGLGVNLGLKMSGDSEYKQSIEYEGEVTDDKRSNTVPSVGVEVGGLFDLGYSVNRWLVVDLRIIQNFTNLLDLDLIAESTLMNSKLYTMHIGVGATLLL